MENHVVLRSKVLSRPGGNDYFQLDIQATFPLDPATGTIADKDSVTRHRLDCITRLVLDSVEDPATRKATSENPTPAPERRLNLASDLYHTHSRPLQPNITAPGIPLNLASDLDDIDSDLNPLQSNSTNDSCPGLSVANGTQRLTSASTGGEPEVEPTRKKRKRSPKPAASDHESFNPDWWIWKRLNKDEVRAVADEVVRMVIDAKDHSWSKIDSRHAPDPAEVVTADDLP
ncbi:hypothetical protein B0A54_18054 [Friedmanniomyces endolithicus]|uniref:Uncharacterized protein n=1 Tax=Friedmanniomyces endolithicus TaxID=329885 RepID=A0A4U0TPP4_9PEZI|nr:hypothetical protein B0A54_18054 [Friedmanniomyces endolithicus]